MVVGVVVAVVKTMQQQKQKTRKGRQQTTTGKPGLTGGDGKAAPDVLAHLEGAGVHPLPHGVGIASLAAGVAAVVKGVTRRAHRLAPRQEWAGVGRGAAAAPIVVTKTAGYQSWQTPWRAATLSGKASCPGMSAQGTAG